MGSGDYHNRRLTSTHSCHDFVPPPPVAPASPPCGAEVATDTLCATCDADDAAKRRCLWGRRLYQ